MPHHVVNSCTTSRKSLHSFWGLSKNRDIIDETYVIKLIAVVGVLTAVILVLANLQTMTDPLILPSRREHSQQSVHKDIEQLRGRNASLRYTCIKCDCCTFCVVWSQTGQLHCRKSAPVSQRVVYETCSSHARELPVTLY